MTTARIKLEEERSSSFYWQAKLEELKNLIYSHAIETPIAYTWWSSTDRSSIKIGLEPLLKIITAEDIKSQNQNFKLLQKELAEKQLKKSFEKTKTRKDNSSYNLVLDAIEVYAALNSISKKISTTKKLEESHAQALKELDENIRRQVSIVNKKQFVENRNHSAMRRRINKFSQFIQETNDKLLIKSQKEVKESKLSEADSKFWINKIEEWQTPLYQKAINELLVTVLREGLQEEFRSQYIPENIFSILENYNSKSPFSTSEFSEIYGHVGYVTRKNGLHHGYTLHSEFAIKFINLYGNLNWIKAILGTIVAGGQLSHSSVQRLQALCESIENALIPLSDHIDELYDSFNNLNEQQNIFNYIKIVIESIEIQIKENWINELTNVRVSNIMRTTITENNTEAKVAYSSLSKDPLSVTATPRSTPIEIKTPVAQSGGDISNKQKMKILRNELRRIITDENSGLAFYANKHGAKKYDKSTGVDKFLEEVLQKTINTPDKQAVEQLKDLINKITVKIMRIDAKEKRASKIATTPIVTKPSPAVASHHMNTALPGMVPADSTEATGTKMDSAQLVEVKKESPLAPPLPAISLIAAQIAAKKEEEKKNVVETLHYYPSSLRNQISDINSDESLNYKIKHSLIAYASQKNRRKLGEKKYAMVQAIEGIVSLHEEPGYDEQSKIQNLEDRIAKVKKLALEYGLSPELIEEDAVFYRGLEAIKELILLDESVRTLYAYAGYLNNLSLSEFKSAPCPEYKELSINSYAALATWATTTHKQILQNEIPHLVDLYEKIDKSSTDKDVKPQVTSTVIAAKVEFKKPNTELFLDSSDDEASPLPSPNLSAKSIVKKSEVNKPSSFHERHKGKIRWGSLIFGVLGVAAGVFLALTPTFGIGQAVGAYLIYQGCTIAACAVGGALGGSAIGALGGTMAGASSDCCRRGNEDNSQVTRVARPSSHASMKNIGGLASHVSASVKENIHDAKPKVKEGFKNKKDVKTDVSKNLVVQPRF